MRGIALALVVMAVLAVTWRWNSYVAGGSDSYCYLHQAERWASGRLQEVEPLALRAPWANGPLAFAPAGHVPSGTSTPHTELEHPSWRRAGQEWIDALVASHVAAGGRRIAD